MLIHLTPLLYAERSRWQLQRLCIAGVELNSGDTGVLRTCHPFPNRAWHAGCVVAPRNRVAEGLFFHCQAWLERFEASYVWESSCGRLITHTVNYETVGPDHAAVTDAMVLWPYRPEFYNPGSIVELRPSVHEGDSKRAPVRQSPHIEDVYSDNFPNSLVARREKFVLPGMPVMAVVKGHNGCASKTKWPQERDKIEIAGMEIT